MFSVCVCVCVCVCVRCSVFVYRYRPSDELITRPKSPTDCLRFRKPKWNGKFHGGRARPKLGLKRQRKKRQSSAQNYSNYRTRSLVPWISIDIHYFKRFRYVNGSILLMILRSWFVSFHKNTNMNYIRLIRITNGQYDGCWTHKNFMVLVRSKSLWQWYINTNVMFLDMIHRPAFI
jgi:hypothetical protein